MRSILFLLGLACLLVGCGIFHKKKPVVVIKDGLQMSIVEEDVNWKRGDTLVLGVEIANKTDSAFNIYSQFPAFGLHLPLNPDILQHGLFFVCVEQNTRTGPHVIEPLATDTMAVSFVTAFEPPKWTEMHLQLFYGVTEEEPVPRRFSIVSKDSVKIRISD